MKFYETQDYREMQRQGLGRELARKHVKEFSKIINEVVASDDKYENNVAVFTYGSAGGKFMVSSSDTDIVIIPREDSITQLGDLEDLIAAALRPFKRIWKINFRNWRSYFLRRLKQPRNVSAFGAELRAARFVCGSLEIFDDVLRRQEISKLLDDQASLIAGQARSLLFSDYRSSTTPEGDVKHYKGGSRDIQISFRGAQVLLNERFIAKISPQRMGENGIISIDDAAKLDAALDFMLSTKDIIRGNNLLKQPHLEMLADRWEVATGVVFKLYREHSRKVRELLEHVHREVSKAFELHPQVKALLSKEDSMLARFVDQEDIFAITTMSFRSDLPPRIRGNLREKIDELVQRSSDTNDFLELRKYFDWSSSTGESATYSS